MLKIRQKVDAKRAGKMAQINNFSGFKTLQILQF